MASRRSAKCQGSGTGYVLPCGTLVQKLEGTWVSSASCCLESQKPSVPKGALGVADGNGNIPVTTCLTAPIPFCSSTVLIFCWRTMTEFYILWQKVL